MENLAQGFSFDLPKGNSSIIKVIGVGGGGNNALKHMYEKGIHGVDFIICNTDAQTLNNNPVSNKVQLGISITEGLGAGADPEVGEKAAIESIDDIKAALGNNTKMVFITAGMGGGTGTGAAPVIAKVAKEMGVLTIGIVTVPFSFEGKRRLDQAELGLEKLRANVDSLIVINNDKLRQQFGNLGFKQGFSKADEVLTNAAKGMAEVITGYFDVNIDFRDAKSVLQNSGTALMSTGTATGEHKAEEAVKKALDSPLLNDNKITGAKNVLLLIRSGAEEATMDEIGLINDHIQREAGNTADIIFGVGTDEELGDAISVLVIATGFAKENQKHAGPTEKVKYTLNDDISPRRESPFKSSIEDTKPSPFKENKNLFRLEDEDDEFPTNQFSNDTVSYSTKKVDEAPQYKIIEKIEVQEEEDIDDDEASYNEPDLFSYDENLFDTEEVESQGFSFEVEERETPKTDATKDEQVSFSFSVNNDGNTQAEDNKPEITEFKKEETPKPTFETKEISEPKAEIQEVTEEKQEEEFTFINKTPVNEKVQERRNKLKEFNSRYLSTEAEDDFETVPAFKRKNINLDDQNPSEQNIFTFLSENEKGQVSLRENRFLNKDVD